MITQHCLDPNAYPHHLTGHCHAGQSNNVKRELSSLNFFYWRQTEKESRKKEEDPLAFKSWCFYLSHRNVAYPSWLLNLNIMRNVYLVHFFYMYIYIGTRVEKSHHKHQGLSDYQYKIQQISDYTTSQSIHSKR